MILTVGREGNHSSIQENDGPKLELFAQGEKDFFTKVNDDELTFEVDAQGRVTGMTLHVDGREIPVKRID
ncbi:MAG TPA: hypothetical protein VEU31_11015 [Candidatus Acidoferrales bacterium]|nr:hypothetical protein [Candidatus Acidoferrales bacterium]